jgi:hypothetical protein
MKKDNMIKSIFLCLIVVTFANAQQDTIQTHTESTGWIIISDAVELVPSGFLIIINHEFGHYAMASIFGAQNARFGLSRRKPNGGRQIGWTEWSNDLGGFGNSCAHLGGVLFSRGLAEGSDCLIHHTSLPPWAQRFFSMTFIFGRFDFARYVLNDALVELSGKQGSDISKLVTQIAGQNAGSRFLTYTALFAIATFDLVFDWNRVVMHWNILEGKWYANKSLYSHTQISIHPYFAYGSIGISARVVR